MPAEIKEQVDKLVETTKKGFNLRDRLKNRGLRRGSITVFMDDDKGAELGWTRDIKDPLGNITGRARVGVLGEIEKAEAELHDASVRAAVAIDGNQAAVKAEVAEIEKKIAALHVKRDALAAELTETAIVITARAVPPIVQKDTHRKARQTLSITDKNVPEALMEDLNISQTAHLLTVMVQSVKDNATGDINEGMSYEEAIDLMDYLSVHQFNRLDTFMGDLQFTDAISETIERQEDFS